MRNEKKKGRFVALEFTKEELIKQYELIGENLETMLEEADGKNHSIFRLEKLFANSAFEKHIGKGIGLIISKEKLGL